MNKVSVIGLGYIGLPTALMLAKHGISVVGVDYNEGLVNTLNKGEVTFEEEGLDALLADAIANGIVFSKEYPQSDLYVVAVPTPYDEVSKKIDPTYVLSAVSEILKNCQKGAAIVIESTISPGTINKYVRPAITDAGLVLGEDIHILHAPERIIPGNMIYELEYNSRVIGCDNSAVGEEVKKVYQSFCKGEIVLTDIATAEMAKIVENTYRDVNIAYANELTKICHQGNLDVYEIIRIANMHPRVNILSPGPGVGGHCISVDPWFLVGDYPYLTDLIHGARIINDSMPDYVLERIREVMKESGISKRNRIGIYGLAYKEDVDDMRESPTLQLLQRIEQNLGEPLKVYDPHIKENHVANQYQDFDSFLSETDLLVVMVGHSHIKENFDKIKNKVILDTKNVIALDNVHKL